MTDITLHSLAAGPSIGTHVWRFVARLARAADRILFAHRIRYDLSELPPRLRRDIGLG
ncbi:hypothetical protein [Pseudorhodoplanes sp.]|jgi:hypothetical protein|uniref:hypothetical protein n=1 Tax=Pseudorhodoplanes sp. TaxID=1934341 RepID=UPI002BF56373|nr:hypothetical protein [Pseudorhodoplanes sp.]HWV42603.1 hypothetical protein [Pseudorhodoplanes sp.]